MENLNAEQILEEIDSKIKIAKIVNTDIVILSAKAAQFCLEHAQYYEQKIKELTEEVADLEAIAEQYQKQFEEAKADTVRKMHSMLCEGRVSNDNVVIVANQVAKEMLEGENE